MVDGTGTERCKNNLLVSIHPVASQFSALHRILTIISSAVSPLFVSPTEARFTTTSPLYELPDRRFIAIRAACCRAAHLSGAAKYVDDIYRKTEMTYVLANNGSSAEILQFVLSRLVHSPA